MIKQKIGARSHIIHAAISWSPVTACSSFLILSRFRLRNTHPAKDANVESNPSAGVTAIAKMLAKIEPPIHTPKIVSVSFIASRF